MAWKPIANDEFAAWLARFREAEASIANRDELMEAAAEEMERELLLLGSTAIEDRLQDEVPETIQFLHDANIHVWVLTGDKQSTAISIGMSSRLITPGMGVRCIRRLFFSGAIVNVPATCCLVSVDQVECGNSSRVRDVD